MSIQIVLQLVSAAAVVVLGVSVAALVFRQANLHPNAFFHYVSKLERTGDRPRLLKICNVAPRSPVVQLTAFMLGLELPRKVLAGSAQTYRDLPPTRSFEEIARETAAPESARLTRPIRTFSTLAFVTGLVTAGLAAVAWWQRAWDGGVEGMVSSVPAIQAGLGVVGSLLALRFWLRVRRGCVLLMEDLVPLLTPVEEMTREQKEGAAAARRLRSDWGDFRPSVWRYLLVASAVAVVAACVMIMASGFGAPTD